MTINKLLRNLKWPWLIGAPILIGMAACAQVGHDACTVDLRLAVTTGRSANWLCKSVLGVPAVLPNGISAIDLASLRISVVTTLVGTLFGLIALLSGFKVFLDERQNDDLDDMFACKMDMDLETGEVTGRIVASSDRRCRIQGLVVDDGAGVRLQTIGEVLLGKGELHLWTILPPHFTRPSRLVVRYCVADLASGSTSSFTAEFELLPTGCSSKILTRTWP